MKKVIVSDNPAVADFVRDLFPDFAEARVINPSEVTYRDVDSAEVAGRLPLELASWCGRYHQVEIDDTPRPTNVEEGAAEEGAAAGFRLSSYTIFGIDRVELARFLQDHGLDEYAFERLFPDLA